MRTILINSHAGMQIGWEYVNGKPTMFVQVGNVRRYYGQFFDKQRANDFVTMVECWDENGGNDGEAETA